MIRMIINTGQRTDIPAFYAEWFANRIKEGFVCVRNPYNPAQVSRYRLDPSVVDVIGFCTKNPAPMFPYMDLLKDFGQYCYANAEAEKVLAQNKLHDPSSPFLIGNYMDGDTVHDVPQESWIDLQERIGGL